MSSITHTSALSDWHSALHPFARSDDRLALWQVASALALYLGTWALALWALGRGAPWWSVIPLVILGGGLLVRLFILFHDAGHYSLFSRRWANTATGFITGILTFTPFFDWRHSHAMHHGSYGNLDRRGTGDVWTMTVDEYYAAPWYKRATYAAFRHPLVLLGLGPAGVFLLRARWPSAVANGRDRMSVLVTDLALAAIAVAAYLTVGLGRYAWLQVGMMQVAGMAGIWLFYVQHQFPGVYWARTGEFDAQRAALEGASYYALPGVLRWFTGDIGVHHVHHLRPRIPNYRLRACLAAVPEAGAVPPLTLRASAACLGLRLYDEASGQLVSFAEARRLRAERTGVAAA